MWCKFSKEETVLKCKGYILYHSSKTVIIRCLGSWKTPLHRPSWLNSKGRDEQHFQYFGPDGIA